jgi:hypothetical protein
MIMCRRLRLMRLAMIVMAMTPKDQFFENKEKQDTEQDGCRHFVRVTVLQRMRNNLKKSRTQQSTDRIRNQHADPMRANSHTQRGCRSDAQNAAGQRYGNDPGKSAHRDFRRGKGAHYTR